MKKTEYVKPEIKVVQVKIKGMIASSANRHLYGDEGTAGGEIEQYDISGW